MEIVSDIAVKHPDRADVWVRMCSSSLRQILKSRFENSYNHANALTFLSEKRLVFFRKARKENSKTLAEAVSDL